MSDWLPIESAAPIGERVDVKREGCMEPFGDSTGIWDGEQWTCSVMFIDPHTRRVFRQPTHWRERVGSGGDNRT